MTRRPTVLTHRFRLLLGALCLLLTLGVLPAAASAAGLGAWSFTSAPTLKPPKVQVKTDRSGTAPGLVFIDPFKDFAVTTPEVGQPGGLILDSKGEPVWFHPVSADEDLVDLEAQRYEGKPVLTFWVGQISVPPATALPAGTPENGTFYIYSDHYKLLRTIRAKDGFTADLHEFTLTPQGTALFTADKVVTTTVDGAAGPQQVKLVDSEVQEISLKTGKLVFSWDMLQHVNPADSQVPLPATGGVWDPFHMNSIEESESGSDLLVSARDTGAIYEISHTSGRVIWQLGGAGSTYKVSANATFAYQHDARYAGGDQISMFDDACCDLGVAGSKPIHASRGLILKLNNTTRTATEVRQYEFSPEIAVPSQGDLQTLPDGHEFIGWGQDPYYAEYTAAGKLLYQVTMPAADESYRALKYPWSATPYYAPSIAARDTASHGTVDASWNGATGVTGWRVLAGPSARSLKVVVTDARRTGFQTAITVPGEARYYQVKALGSHGKVLRASRAVQAAPVATAAASDRAVVSAAATTVTIETSEDNRKLGKILAASNGHALYLFTKDTKDVSTCTGTCAEFWKPLVAGTHDTVKAGSGLSAKLLGTAKLSGDRRQVTYNHHPLYTDTSDHSAKTTAGEGADQFGGRWYVLNPKGAEVKPKQSLSNPCNPVCTGY